MSNGRRSETWIAAKGKDGEALAFHNSQYPSVEIIDTFERHIPGSADKILDMVKADQVHLHDIERQDIDIERMESDRMTRLPFVGMCFSFALCFVCVGIGGFLVYTGKDTAGLAALLPPLAVILKSLFSTAKR